jgi:membrane peptidoglycan carboxypeptidase
MTRALTAFGRLTPLIRAGLISGFVVAAVAYPLTAIAGLGAKAGADTINSMPAALTITPSPQTSYIYASDGTTLLTSFYEEDRKYLPLTEMSPWIQKAIVAAEDSRFYQHHGVDMKGSVRAFVANQQAGTVSQGASTLTMQYVRNALRDAASSPQQAIDATAQNSGRKLREMKLAVDLEKHMSKKQILEGYLNVAYFGHRAYGIFAASDVYFSKAPRDLSLDEAATIAGLVQAPTSYDPAGSDQSAALNRRNYVIDRMRDLGYISASDATRTRAKPIALRLTDPPNDCVSVPANHNDWGFFCDVFKQWWMSQPAFGSSPQARLDTLRRGGYRIVTSIDPRIQSIAQREVLAKEAVTSKYAHGTVAIEPGTGLIKAMAVNRVYSLDQSHNRANTEPARRKAGIKGNYPNTVNMLLGGGSVNGYQAGSTFKIFTMLAALEHGMTLNTSIYAPKQYTSIYLTGFGDRSQCGGGHWCPQNASNSMTGVQNMWSGFGKSVNTYWVQVEQRVGAQNAVAMAERLGLTWHTDIDRLQASPAKSKTWGAFTLGVADTTPMEMANAYATVAADGRYCAPLPVLSITGTDGKPAMMKGADGKDVPVATPRCTQAVSQGVARGAADAARCVTGYGAASGGCGGWSTDPGGYGMVKRPFAGKTGTTDDTRAAWFVGFTPELAAASFIADPDNPFDVAGDWNSWKPDASVANTLRGALAGSPVRNFSAPPADIIGKTQQASAPGGSSGSGSSSGKATKKKP